MSEPTIDELIAWVDGLRPARIREVTAIRAILEQHRDYDEILHLREHHQLKVIRAFVERVEKRLLEKHNAFITSPESAEVYLALKAELAAMEAEVKE